MSALRWIALLELLEEVTRAVIDRHVSVERRAVMYRLLDRASWAYHEKRFDEGRAALAELHHIARDGAQPT